MARRTDAAAAREAGVRAALGRQRLLALFAAGMLGLNFPLLVLWDRDASVLGVPLFPAALFVLWVLLILALGLVAEAQPDD